MEKMSSKLSLVLVLGLILLVGVSTGIKVTDRHKEKLLLVSKSKIEGAARKCYLDGKCTGDSTNLANLIALEYLEAQIHPISKEFISEDLVIYCKDFICNTTLR